MIPSNKAYYLLPLLFLALFAPFSEQVDLWASSLSFQGTHFYSNAFFNFIDAYGPFPALACGITALAVWIVCSYWKRNSKHWCPPAAVLSLVLIVGPGLLANVLIKDHWGRPRPRQLEQFTGDQEYRPFYQANWSWSRRPFRSFPSGHVTMGFYFLTLAWLGRRHDSLFWTRAGMISGITLGLILAITRVVQGAHFVSDTVGSAILMWYTIEAVGALVYKVYTPKV